MWKGVWKTINAKAIVLKEHHFIEGARKTLTKDTDNFSA
jgi:hypothetical protein